MTRFYGWFSLKAATNHGAVCYRAVDGQNVWVTLFQKDKSVLDVKNYLWDDTICVGEITMEEVGRYGPDCNQQEFHPPISLKKDCEKINILDTPILKENLPKYRIEKFIFNEKINLNSPEDESSNDD